MSWCAGRLRQSGATPLGGICRALSSERIKLAGKSLNFSTRSHQLSAQLARPSPRQHPILRPKGKQEEQKNKLRQTALPSRAFRALCSQSCQSQPKQYAVPTVPFFYGRCIHRSTTNRPNKNVGCSGRLTDMCEGVANHITRTKRLLACIRTMLPFADA